MSDDGRVATAEEAPERPGAHRRVLPPEMIERSNGPFALPPGVQALRGQGPVQPLPLLNGAHAFVVTGFEEARTVLADPRFSADRMRHHDVTQLKPEQVAELGEKINEPVEIPAREDGMFIFMDPPEHTRLRRLLTGQFTVRRMRQLEDRLTEIANEHIAAMKAAGDTADLVPAYALPIPSLMICEMLGVDYADRAEFQENAKVTLDTTASDEDRAVSGLALYQFIAKLVETKKKEPTDDILSGLIHDADPPLTDAQLIDVSLVLLGAGHETTANMLGLGTFALLQNPDQWDALRADPSLVDNAVEELLRVLTIVQLGVTRITTEAVTLGGVDIPAGSTVVLAIPEANRDAGHWPEPDRIDVRRSRSPHLAFGHGVHQCLGQQLARIEMRIGFAELVKQLPDLKLAVPAEEVPLRNEMVVFGVHSLPVTWS